MALQLYTIPVVERFTKATCGLSGPHLRKMALYQDLGYFSRANVGFGQHRK